MEKAGDLGTYLRYPLPARQRLEKLCSGLFATHVAIKSAVWVIVCAAL
jgi:hypothetical protein